MDSRALPQQLQSLLLGAGGLLLAIFVGWNIGSANYTPLILWSVVVGIAFLGLLSGRFFWVLTIASSFLGGTFPILGGSFTPFQVLMAMGVAKFLIEDIVLRRTRVKTGNKFDLFLLIGFMGVLTLHALHDRFGMRFLGSSVWGGRNYINVYVGLAAFFVVQSIPMTTKIWAKFPYLVLAVTAFDLSIVIITTIFPSSIYTIYPFYSAVSVAGIEELTTGSSVETARLGGFGNFGFALIALVLASVSLRQILKPPILFRLGTLAVGAVAVLVSSFRSAVLNTLGVLFIAGIRDLKWGVLLLLLGLTAMLFGLSVVNSDFIQLPKQVQRSVAFVPGKWDTEMKLDATASNEFRGRVWTLWAREYFPAHPWIGRGFGFRSEWAKGATYQYDPNADQKMVEVGNIHSGFFATVDTFGVIGTIFFVVWNLRLLAQAIRVPLRWNDRSDIPLRFVALCLGSSILFYWVGALNVGTFLPQEFALAAVFLRLRRDALLKPIPLSLTEERRALSEKLAVA